MLGFKVIHVNKRGLSKHELLINTGVGFSFRFPIIRYDWACIFALLDNIAGRNVFSALYNTEYTLIFNSVQNIFI